MTAEVRRRDLSPGRTRFWDGDPWGWQQLWLTPDAVVQGVRLRYGVPATSATLLADGMLDQTWRSSRSAPWVGWPHTPCASGDPSADRITWATSTRC